MTTAQINAILQTISNIENVDIDKIPETIFKDKDITIIKIGTYLLPDYIIALKRMLIQLKSELSDDGIYFPFQYTLQNEFGSGNFTLQNDLNNLLNHINQKNHAGLNTSVSFLNRLIYYQVANGFWDKSKMKVHKSEDVKLSELNGKLKIISEQLSNNQESFKTQITALENEKKKLETFITQKNTELQQITTNLQSSNTNSSQINTLLNQSTASNEKINSLLTQENQSFEAQKKKIEEQNSYFTKQKETFSDIENQLNDKVKTLEAQIIDFNQKLEFVEDKKSFFEERNNYLENLIGREVGVSLFETFKQRKNELAKPVKNWLWIVIGMSGLTFLAIIMIFTNGFGWWGDIPKDFTTIQLITNTIKTFPFFFLLFYSISQYNKERNFQEEYAFKSAVALTIKAYADIIKEESIKDEMIISSVNAVYKSPNVEKSRNKKDNNAILETAKDLLATALDVMKKR